MYISGCQDKVSRIPGGV